MSEKVDDQPSPSIETGLTLLRTASVAGQMAIVATAESHPIIESELSPDTGLIIDAEHTAELRANVLEHGMSIRRGNIGNVPNESAFRTRFGLSSQDTDAIGVYKGSAAQFFNGYLRGESRYPSLYGREFQTLLGLFAEQGKLPTTKGGELVFRGFPIAPEALSEELVDPAFMSCSVSQDMAAGFAASAKGRNGSGYLLRMVLPEGIHYLPSGGGEQEVILQPGLRIVFQKFIHNGSPDYAQAVGALSDRHASLDIDGIIEATVQTAQPIASEVAPGAEA